MAKSKTTSGKRLRQERQRVKAQAKLERRAERRQVAAEESPEPVESTESELIDELAGLHRSLEAGELSLQDFEGRREHIRTQLEQLQ